MELKEEKELKELISKRDERMAKLNQFIKGNKIRYRFYRALKDIDVRFSDDKLICSIKKGTNLIGVGYGIGSNEFKKEIIFFTDVNELLKNKSIEFINDPVESLKIAESFNQFIIELEVFLTSQVLTHLDLYEEFLRIPDHLKPKIRNQIEEILK